MTEDLRDLLDQALNSYGGISLSFPTRQESVNFRMALYASRRRVAAQNARLYPQGDPLHDASPYDHLQVRLSEDGLSLHIAPRPPIPKATLTAALP